MDIQSPTIDTLMKEVASGHVVLPEFQRDFVWRAEDIKDLLVSALADYYVGTMLFMDVLSEKTEFATRLLNGVEERFPGTKQRSIVKLLLDGQQRCSALFYALYEPDLPLAGRKTPYRFAMHIEKALDGQWEDAVVFYAFRSNSTSSAYDSDEYIRFADFMDTTKLVERLSKNKWQNRLSDIFTIVNRFNQFKIQMVELRKDTPIDTVVEIFERINRTGMQLNITDLLVARLLKRDIKLRDLISYSNEAYEFANRENGVPDEFILRVMCLLRGHEVNKKNILTLDPNNFSNDWESACDRLEEAFRKIVDATNGYGAIDFRRFCPFRTMIVPLAVLLHEAKRHPGSAYHCYQKIDQWYWVSVFYNRYNEAVNSNTFSDIAKMKLWFQDDQKIPDFVKNFNPLAVDFLVSSKTSSTYRGVLCLILKEGALDFRSGKSANQDLSKLQDDHIFPRVGFSDNTILNRSLILTNSEKSNQQPGKYFSALETVHGRDGLLKILSTHIIDAECLEALRTNDIDRFRKARSNILLSKFRDLVPSSDYSQNTGVFDSVSPEEMVN